MSQCLPQYVLPNTGDYRNVALYIIIALISAFVIVLLFVIGKKNKG